MSVLLATEYLGVKTSCFVDETDLGHSVFVDDRDTMSMIGGTTFKRPSDSAESNECHVRSANCDELRKKTRYRFQLLITRCCVHLIHSVNSSLQLLLVSAVPRRC